MHANKKIKGHNKKKNDWSPPPPQKASKYRTNWKKDCSEVTENKECFMLFYISKNKYSILLTKSTPNKEK